MNWKNTVFHTLSQKHLFENDGHRSRFKELLDCYYDAPFFTPGLCKCMYLSCWDEEHFIIMLDILNQLNVAANITLTDMLENGKLMEEESGKIDDFYILRLSCDFLTNQPFDLTEVPDTVSPYGRHILLYALKTSAVIDEIAEQS